MERCFKTELSEYLNYLDYLKYEGWQEADDNKEEIPMKYFDTLSKVQDAWRKEQKAKDKEKYEHMHKAQQRQNEKRRREEDEADPTLIRNRDGVRINKAGQDLRAKETATTRQEPPRTTRPPPVPPSDRAEGSTTRKSSHSNELFPHRLRHLQCLQDFDYDKKHFALRGQSEAYDQRNYCTT
eukprot:5475152-Amphidinium_carterae.2